MLILSRKIDESIHIGDNIRVTVLGIEKGVAKIGIEAPESMTILRDELYIAISNENKAASSNLLDEKILKNFFHGIKKR